MKYFREKTLQSGIKKFTSAILCMGIIFAGILLSSCQDSNFVVSSNSVKPLDVSVEYERHEDLPGIYKIDIMLPKIEGAGDGIERINETIQSEFTEYYNLNAANANEILGGWKYPQINISYQVIRLQETCTLSVITEIHSEEDEGKELSVRNYYYDEAEKKDLNTEEYLGKIGLTAENITQSFIENEGQDYHLEQIVFSSLQNHFYINEEKKPVFFVVE